MHEKLQRALLEAPTPAALSNDFPFIAYPTVSNICITSMIPQDTGAGEQPIAYYSRALTAPEGKLGSYEQTCPRIPDRTGEVRIMPVNPRWKQGCTLFFKQCHNSKCWESHWFVDRSSYCTGGKTVTRFPGAHAQETGGCSICSSLGGSRWNLGD